MQSRMRRRRRSASTFFEGIKVNMSLEYFKLFTSNFTRDIIHAIVMTFLAFFNQQQTLFRRQSVKSEHIMKFNGEGEKYSFPKYPQRLIFFRPSSYCWRTHLLGKDGIFRMCWLTSGDFWMTLPLFPWGCAMCYDNRSCFRTSNIMISISDL